MTFQEWRSPDAFDEGSTGHSRTTLPVGEPIYLGITHERHSAEGSIRIRDVQPDLGENDAEATVEYFLCTVDPSSGVGSIGSVDARLIGDECSELVAAEGQEMELNARPRQQLVLAVTPTKPGTVTVEGTELSYSYGWRRGTQRLGDSLELVARQ